MPTSRRREQCKKAGVKGSKANATAIGELGPSARVRRSRRPSPNHASSAAARLSVAAATPEWEIKRKEKEERSIGVGDVVEVLCSGGEVSCSGDSAPSAAWLEATVAWVDKPNGLYCAARTSSVGTLVVGDARLRLVAKAGRRDFAATCAADAAFLAQIEAWPEERLRAMQDYCIEMKPSFYAKPSWGTTACK